jgi:Skp family chaperone for outer membrane proteins
MRVVSTFSAAALAVAALAVSSDAMAQRNRGQSTTAVVINYQRVAAESVLGRDMQAKLAALRQQFAGEAQALAPEQQSLQQERDRLAQASRNMTPQQIQNSSTLAPQFQQFQQRAQQFEGRTNALRGDMECSNLIALRDFDRMVSPIVRSVMESRGAGMVVDSSNVTVSSPEFDITTTVIQQLDQNQNTRTANVARHAVAECQAQQPAASQ